MLKDHQAISAISREINASAEDIIGRLGHGTITQEPDLTSQLITSIRIKLNGLLFNNLHVNVDSHVLDDRAPGAEESIYGADLLCTVEINTHGFSARKGFLAQAKLVRRPDLQFENAQANELSRQCRLMLNHTSEAFVWVYSTTGIFVVPAITAVSVSKRPWSYQDVYYRNLRGFFTLFMSCFVGEERISSAHPTVLHAIKDSTKNHLLITINDNTEINS